MWKPYYSYLQDKEFMQEIDNLTIGHKHVRVIALDWERENPIAEIQGYATGGTINANGSSAVRRSGSLSLVADDTIYKILDVNNLISINKKIAVEVGFTNTTLHQKYKDYDVIWIPLGVFIIKNASITRNNSGLNISVQLSDKMCLLNGDVSGKFPAPVNLSEVAVLDSTGQKVGSEYFLLEDIIRNLVNEYGGVQLGQIFINDIGRRVKALVTWTGVDDLVRDPSDSQLYPSSSIFENTETWEHYKKGYPIGYIFKDFIWPGKEALTCNLGEAVTAALDKIKNALGNFEYFFDVYGNFIFQEIKNYENTKVDMDSIEKGLNYFIKRNKMKTSYEFTDGKLGTSFGLTPQYANIKNDFIIWGEKETGSGKVAIRYHLAIHKKPEYDDTPYLVEFYQDVYGTQVKPLRVNVDYQEVSEKSKMQDKNMVYILNTDSGFYKYFENLDDFAKLKTPSENYCWLKVTDWRTKLYMDGKTNKDSSFYANRYAKELEVEWAKIYDMLGVLENENGTYGLKVYSGKFKDIDTNDYQYFLDFIEGNAENPQIQDLSVENIGLRQLVENNTSVKCIFDLDIPNFIVIESGTRNTQQDIKDAQLGGYEYSLVSTELFEQLTLTSAFNSAYSAVVNKLYNSIGYNESITIGTLPIFHLEPNTLIETYDEKTSICGKYFVKSIAYPLAPNGTMNLSCTKPIEKM